MKLDCGHEPSPHETFTTGYGITPDGRKICYTCCAEQDKEQMRKMGKATLYLKIKRYDSTILGQKAKGIYCKAELTNWPGSFVIPCFVHMGRHNIAGKQYNVRFEFEGKSWRGIQCGDNTELCHCRRNK